MIYRIVIFLFFVNVASAQERIEVFFEFDKFELTKNAMTALDLAFADNSQVEVSRIYGYCDWKGSNSYNDTLSFKRVDAVFEYLSDKKVRIKDGYELRGFGEDFKQDPDQAANRKVVVIYDKIQPPVDPNSLSSQVSKAKKGDKIKLQNIHFFNNSPRIVPRSEPTLNELLCIMEENPNLKIEIQGHICCQLKEDSNDVSTARAKAVFNFLIRNKISRDRLSYKGFGITKPIHPIPEKTEAQADENRRVEILIVEN